MRKDNLNVTFNGNNYTGYEKYEALPLGAALLYAAQQIDEAADSARVAVVGNSLRVVEYQLAEQEAQAFQVAGFEGEVPATVQALSLIHISEPTRPRFGSRMPSSA